MVLGKIFHFFFLFVFLNPVRVKKYQTTPKTLNLLIKSEIFQMVSFVRLFSEHAVFNERACQNSLIALLNVFKLLLFSVPCCIAQQLEEAGRGCNNFTLLLSRDRKQPLKVTI